MTDERGVDDRGARSRNVKPGGEKRLQHILWPETIYAINRSISCSSISELIAALRSELPQNSSLTRSRNASIILSRFFPGHDIDCLPRRIMLSYKDDDLLASVLRALLPLAEPILGRMFSERLHPLDSGTELPKGFFKSFGEEFGGAMARDVGKRTSTASRDVGWTLRQRGRTYRAATVVDRTAALLLLHHVYAPTPRIVDVNQVLAEPLWKFLAFPTPDALRAFLRELERKGLVSRYAQVDRLEQVTTRYSLDELIARKVRL